MHGFVNCVSVSVLLYGLELQSKRTEQSAPITVRLCAIGAYEESRSVMSPSILQISKWRLG